MFGFRNKNCETTKANSLLAGKPTKTSVAGDVLVSRFESSVEVSAVSLLLDKPYLWEGGGRRYYPKKHETVYGPKLFVSLFDLSNSVFVFLQYFFLCFLCNCNISYSVYNHVVGFTLCNFTLS